MVEGTVKLLKLDNIVTDRESVFGLSDDSSQNTLVFSELGNVSSVENEPGTNLEGNGIPVESDNVLKKVRCSNCGWLMLQTAIEEHRLRFHSSPEIVPIRPEQSNKLYHCPECANCTVKTLPILRQHMQTFHPDCTLEIRSETPWHECYICNKKFRSEATMKEHVIVLHSLDKPYHCEICLKKFHSEKRLNAHTASNHGPKIHKCDKCEAAYPSQKQLYHHRVTHTDKKTVCSICGKSYRGLREHIHKVHQGKITRSVPCPYCKKTVCTTTRLKEHINNIHLNIREFKCDICDKDFPSQNRLSTHNRERHNVNWKRGPVKYKMCPVCGLSVTSNTITQHVASHSDVKAFTCDVCGKQLKLKHHLENHMTKHGDVRPHPCAHCDLRFKLAHHMRAHVDRKHPKVKDTAS